MPQLDNTIFVYIPTQIVVLLIVSSIFNGVFFFIFTLILPGSTFKQLVSFNFLQKFPYFNEIIEHYSVRHSFFALSY